MKYTHTFIEVVLKPRFYDSYITSHPITCPTPSIDSFKGDVANLTIKTLAEFLRTLGVTPTVIDDTAQYALIWLILSSTSSDIHNDHELNLLCSQLLSELQAYGIPGGFNENRHFLDGIIHLLPSAQVGLSQYVGTVTVPTLSIPSSSSTGLETVTASAQNNPLSIPIIGQETTTASSSNLDSTSTAIPSSTDRDANMTEASNNTSGSNQ
ncbi:hypothetical protein L218DRAFT_943276 [Marasmius fiardii PR-910]|nr:hypothetical protein L218DRAFT_943276 [Marasmius fiardii PR-910]